MKNPLLEAALSYAKRGLPVFPLLPGGKDPLTKRGFKDATTVEKKIRTWWTQQPNANIGLATGKASGLFVLDVDCKHGKDGEASLRALLNGHAALADTLEQSTPSGGRHLIFSAPKGRATKCTAGTLGPGLDTRGDGGYIVVAPSRTAEGAYKRLNKAAPAPAPDWLLSRTRAAKRQHSDASRITEGARNVELTRIAGSLRARGLDADALLRSLRVVNLERCDPPLPDAEVATIARSVAGYPARRPCTDFGNAERLVDAAAGALQYVPDAPGWIVECDGLWNWQSDAAVAMQYGKLVARALLAEAHAEEDASRRTALARWAVQSESAGRVHAMVDLAKTEPALRIGAAKLDADAWLLGVQGGVIDLRSGAWRKARPEDYITKHTGCAFDAAATCPTWLKFLERIFAGDAELIAYVQRMLGYALTGDVGERVVFFLHGAGANGKTTLLEALLTLLGDYGAKAKAETFMVLRNRGGASPELAALRGVRCVVASELTDAARFNEALIKDLSGGDTVAARELYKAPTTFRMQGKLFFFGNHKPRLREDDQAAWDRLHLVPFEVRIPEAERDQQLAQKLRAELSGILNWALTGLVAWRTQGLCPPAKVRHAVAAYREEQDALGHFLTECTTEDVSGVAEVRSADLYKAYCDWATRSGERPISHVRFSQRLTARGVASRLLEGRRLWGGLVLQPPVGTVPAGT